MQNRNRRLTGWAAALAAVALLSACGDRPGSADKPSPTVSATPSPTAAVPAETSMPEGKETVVDSFVEQAKSDAPADELMKALGQSVTAAGPAGDDEMLRAMDEYYTRNLPVEEKKFQAGNVQQVLMEALKVPVTKEQVEDIKDEEVRKLVQGSMAGGYKLDTAEGMWFPVIDYSAMKGLADAASPAMKDYLTLMALESDEVMSKDAALVIGREELLRRTLSAEAYVTEYKDAPEREKVKLRYARYLWAYLLGLDNTPTTVDDFMLNPKFKVDMEQMVKDHPGTVTAKLTEKFLGILEKTGGKVFTKEGDAYQNPIPEVQAFIDGLEQEAMKELDS